MRYIYIYMYVFIWQPEQTRICTYSSHPPSDYGTTSQKKFLPHHTLIIPKHFLKIISIAIYIVKCTCSYTCTLYSILSSVLYINTLVANYILSDHQVWNAISH